MPRKCIVYGCRSGYKTTKAENTAELGTYIKKTVFTFPDDPDLCRRWLKFANREVLTIPSDSANCNDDNSCGICIDHFEEKYINRGKICNRLDHNQHPVPTIQTNEIVLSKPSLVPTVSIPRKPPIKRTYEHPLLDQTAEFRRQDNITSFADLNEIICPEGYTFQKIGDDSIMYMRIIFEDGAPNIESITVDSNLHVKLHYKGNPLPLPEWFRRSGCKSPS